MDSGILGNMDHRTPAEKNLEEAALEFARAMVNGARGNKMEFARIQLYAEARNFADARDEENDG